MNSARCARFAVDCRPHSGFEVYKELKLQRIHFGFCFDTRDEGKDSGSLGLEL